VYRPNPHWIGRDQSVAALLILVFSSLLASVSPGHASSFNGMQLFLDGG